MNKGLCWIRRDLRLHDHAALSQCTHENDLTYIAFIFDDAILGPLRKRAPSDRRIQFIVESLLELHQNLRAHQGGIIIRYGNPVEEVPKMMLELNIDNLYFNRDYTTYAQERDALVTQKLLDMGRSVYTHKDCVIFEPTEIHTHQKTPYRIFTPYARAWRSALNEATDLSSYLSPFPAPLTKFAPINPHPALKNVEALSDFAGFTPDTTLTLSGGSHAGLHRLEQFVEQLPSYHITRDIPAIQGTSQLSAYLRHGCLSIRDMVNKALTQPSIGSEKWLNELIWREFYQMIFYHFPEVHTLAFQKQFRTLHWPGSDTLLTQFKNGQTGFPLIDAAMRCLNQTGWMHNRLRMVTASFMTKILLIDWKKGERYFSWKLLDYDAPSNNGGWQWAAGIGCDAAPYFRIFNPTTQSQTYDPEGVFIRTFCPELRPLNNQQIHCPSTAKNIPNSFQLGRDYPFPIVDYRQQRLNALAFYKNGKMAS